MPRLLIVSHGHAELSAGGAERASYAIHSLIRRGRLPGWDSVYLARVEPRDIGHDGDLGTFRGRADEVLIAPPPVDHFFMVSLEPDRLFRMFDAVVERYRPDLVHIHHFVYFGTDILGFFAARGIPIVFTFHEYISICHNFGQMVKTNGRLCEVSSPSECNSCFPEHTSGMFFLRRETIIERLAAATLISPSSFLRDRIEDWSASRLPVTVIENPRDTAAYDPVSAGSGGDRDQKIVGYFGQLNHFKGTATLLEAFRILKERAVPVRLRLFGANLEMQDEKFRERTKAQVEALGDTVEFFGPYRNGAVIRLMAACDAVVIPSIWWENSPVVIQEAIQSGVSVIASRLGGIQEKLADYPAASFFETGSASDLAEHIASRIPIKTPHQAGGKNHSPIRAEDHWTALTSLYQRSLIHVQPGAMHDVELRENPEGNKPSRRRIRRQTDVQAGGRRSLDEPYSPPNPSR